MESLFNEVEFYSDHTDLYRYLVNVMTSAPMLELSDERQVKRLLPEFALVECKTTKN